MAGSRRRADRVVKEEKEKPAVAGAKKPLTLTLSRWPGVERRKKKPRDGEDGEENDEESRNVKLSWGKRGM